MGKTKKITILLILLIFVSAAIGALYSSQTSTTENKSNINTQTQYIEIYHDVEVASTQNIISDQYVKDIENTNNLIIIGKEGIYQIQGGAVLVEDKVITLNNQEASVYNIENPEFSVSSN